MDKLDIKKISEQVRQLGAFSHKDIFEDKDFQFISNHLINLTKKEKKIYFPISLSDHLIKFLKIDFNKIYLSKKLIKIADNLNFSKIASEILEHEVNLEVLDCYLSQKSKSTILEWHNDIGYNSHSITTEKDFLKKAQSTIDKKKTQKSSMGVKFFIYLTDVKSNDGALGIIPYSHKIVYALTKLILEKKINLQSFWKLKDLRNILLNQDHKKYVLDYIEKSELEKFIEQTKFVEDTTGETSDFDFEMRKNSVVIFDEMAVHRGSAPFYNDRLVLRYLYRRKL